VHLLATPGPGGRPTEVACFDSSDRPPRHCWAAGSPGGAPSSVWASGPGCSARFDSGLLGRPHRDALAAHSVPMLPDQDVGGAPPGRPIVERVERQSWADTLEPRRVFTSQTTVAGLT